MMFIYFILVIFFALLFMFDSGHSFYFSKFIINFFICILLPFSTVKIEMLETRRLRVHENSCPFLFTQKFSVLVENYFLIFFFLNLLSLFRK